MRGTISAIVPTYNRADLLAETLAALAVQTRPLMEIIVWDDGSSDHTETVARAASGPVRYFKAQNGGKSRALNCGLAEATGDYIWICDDDDIALPDAAAVLAAPLDESGKPGVSGGAYLRFRDDPASGERHQMGPGYWPDLQQGSVLRHLLEDIFLFQNAMFVHRDCYRATGPFREDLPRSIDYDMMIRLAARFPVHMTEDPVFLQRKHDGVRGPANARHAAAQSDAVWKQADRAVFAPFRTALPLALYEAMYAGDAAAKTRAALLQRACVYARRTDWAVALEDFEAAAALAPDRALCPVEQAICRRAMSGKHGVSDAANPDILAAFRRLRRTSVAGAQITSAMRRGLMWRLRMAVKQRHLAETVMILKLASALTGLRFAAAPIPRIPLAENTALILPILRQ